MLNNGLPNRFYTTVFSAYFTPIIVLYSKIMPWVSYLEVGLRSMARIPLLNSNFFLFNLFLRSEFRRNFYYNTSPTRLTIRSFLNEDKSVIPNKSRSRSPVKNAVFIIESIANWKWFKYVTNSKIACTMYVGGIF